MTLFFIFKAHYIKRDKECGTFAFILAFSRHGKKIERERGGKSFSSSSGAARQHEGLS
jgi:hypothetical protein